ncbi:MAG: DinB family protein [Vicinamibacteria bacterium]
MPIVLSAEERESLISDYERGATVLRTAWESIPEDAEKWRPAPDKWSAHEVIIHCADSETYAATRIRLLLGEREPVIIGYDQDAWATIFNYHAQSTDRALRTIDAVRAGTLPILRTLTDADWMKEGRHTQSGAYTVSDWLKSYGSHLINHAKQIDRNLAAFRVAQGHK